MEKNKNKAEVMEFEMDGRNYYFDLKEICSFITNSTNGTNEERIEREILNSYDLDDEDEGLTLSSKTVREITGPNDGTMPNIRYDLLKIMLIQLITFNDKNKFILPNSNGEQYDVPVICVEHLPFGTRLIFNTFIKEGIIKIKENKK